MDDSDPAAPATRRAVVGGIAGLAAGGLLSRPAAADDRTRVTVLNQNVSLGVDLSQLLEARSLADVRRIAGRILDGVEPALYDARAGAIADAVADSGADVVALQEVAVLRTQRPGDFGSESSEPARTVVVDFLDRIMSALSERGLDYTVAGETVTTDLELPAGADGEVDVRVTDRDVLLVRGDHETGDVVTDTYTAAIRLPLPGGGRVALRRGYCLADVTVDGVGFTAVSTHLESLRGSVRGRQAEELLALLPERRPVVLCGDFNSGPGGDTYETLTGAFEDVHATLRPGADGFTCCQAPTLRNADSRLDSRIDGILVRGEVRPRAIRRVNHRPADRVEATVGGETVQVWPSDHAGLVGTVEIEAAGPTPTATRTATATPTEAATATRTVTERGTAPAGTTAGGAGPGVGALGALAAVALGVLSRLAGE
jgi:endonuclease/exonuclease/phosphatase family metal-dependent hydrolase